ncbi:MAG: cytochrome c [Rubrivivax sp.]|nr:cytochrome c [Rubrivivax sp.]
MTRFLVAALLGLATALPAAAQFRNTEHAIKYRQSVMQLQAFHFGRIAAMASGRIPFDAKVAAEDAALLDTIDKLPFVAFVDGSDKGGNTRAKPEIWKERGKFDAAASKLQEEAAKLNAAARTGSLDQIRAAAGGVDQSCRACHDAYQAK